SKPEWIQFIVQYLFTFSMFGYWVSYNKRLAATK
ncbi:MAG TPA: hydrogenase, partial [Gammaproteobacteria bacterium]|nr:hydrogenase [Gammaproteobacteria bacterium]HBA98501.1 hydrogenase [Gammaproteobacteria bacterium]